MKQIYFMLLIAVMLTLWGCFSKWESQETASGSWEQQEIINQEDTTQEDDSIEQEENEEWDDVNLDEESEQANETNSQEETNQTETNVESENSASGSVQDEELESYEADLEDLFRDILGELDENETSE